MATDLQQTLARIVRKAESLSERYEAVLKSKHEADARVEELEKEVYRQNEEIRYLRSQIEYLTVVTVADPQRKDVEQSRATITRLVQEIDKCIADLSE